MGESPGIPFGSYVLLKRLARGGMAEVFLGRQQGLQGFDRLVAVKRVLPHLADSPEFIRMFFDEARLAAKLSHPNCVHIYEFGKVAEDYFIAMEYVHGVHSGQLIAHAATESLPPALIARLGADACSGLHYAHELRDEAGRGLTLVHRDVSPPNLLISYDGTTKLVDFGIAKAAITVEQTKPGVVKGKFAYMSPEQTIGSKLTGKSDVFSLAMVMWELLAGQVVVSRDDKVAAMKSIRDGQLPPIESVRPDIPPALSAALRLALHVDPLQRASALDFKLALEEYIKTSPVLGSSIELGQWIQERFPWESPTGDREIDQLLTRATASAPELPSMPTVLPSADYGVLSGEIDNRIPFDPERPRLHPSDPVRRRFPDIAVTIPTADLEEATQITDSPPHLQPRSATDLLPEARRRPEIYSPITIAAATGQKLPGQVFDPQARLKRIGAAAGAALVIGVVVFAAVSGDGSATGSTPARDRAATTTRAAKGRDAEAAAVETSAPHVPVATAVRSADTPTSIADRRATPADADTPRAGAIEIAITPPGAHVMLGENEQTGSPVRFSNLPPDRYRLVVTLDGYVSIDRTIEIEAGQNRGLELSMIPSATLPGGTSGVAPADTVPSPPPPDPLVRRPSRRDDRPGQLIVRTMPYSVAWLGGRKLDTTPFTRELKPGRYVLTFRHPRHRAQHRTVTIRPGRKTKLSFELD